MKLNPKKSMIILALILSLVSLGIFAQDRQRRNRNRDRNRQRYVQTIYCESGDMRRHWCSEGIGADVRLIRQRSKSQCVRGRTWGVGRNGIWVDRGCRADFVVSR